MITEKEKILNFLSNNKEKLTIEFGVNSIGLFGSYINNIQNRESDIDILIDVKDFYFVIEIILGVCLTKTYFIF